MYVRVYTRNLLSNTFLLSVCVCAYEPCTYTHTWTHAVILTKYKALYGLDSDSIFVSCCLHGKHTHTYTQKYIHTYMLPEYEAMYDCDSNCISTILTYTHTYIHTYIHGRMQSYSQNIKHCMALIAILSLSFAVSMGSIFAR